MEEITATSPVPAQIKCDVCYHYATDQDAFCNNCGYPLQGTEQEQNDFKADRLIKQIDLEEHQKQVKRAGTSLYVIAGLNIVGTIFEMGTARDTSMNGLIMGVGLVLSLLFVCLAIWSRAKPTAALITGLSLFILVNLLAAIGDPLNLVKGIIMKIIIIGYLIRGIKSSLDADRIAREHNL